MLYSHPSQDPFIRELVREERAKQREEIKKQQAAEKHAAARAARREKYKQTKDDSFFVFAWKELMR
jgi:hypothetical protein